MSQIKLFRHTGRPESVDFAPGETVGELRRRLSLGGLSCHINGMAVADEQELLPGAVVVFSGQVTGG